MVTKRWRKFLFPFFLWMGFLFISLVGFYGCVPRRIVERFVPPKIVAGGNHGIVLASDGTLWGWGFNRSGELGDGTTVDKPFAVRIGQGMNFTSITAGGGHTLAMKSDGTLWAWGWDEYGR